MVCGSCLKTSTAGATRRYGRSKRSTKPPPIGSNISAGRSASRGEDLGDGPAANRVAPSLLPIGCGLMLTHHFAQPVLSARAVLLGADGFLAHELRQVFSADGLNVRAVGSKELDLTGVDAVSRLIALFRPDDAVLMMAGLTPDKGRDVATLMKYLRMAESVCAAIAQNPPAHLIYISSDSVYDARYSSF